MSTVKLHDDWTEFLRLLNVHRVRFVVVGAHAVAAQGRPRLTADLDVFVEPTRVNARRLVAAISELGFGVLDADELAGPDAFEPLARRWGSNRQDAENAKIWGSSGVRLVTVVRGHSVA